MVLEFHSGRRLSYEGSLCTVRYFGNLEGTKGEWLGVEWDDNSRGKHDGKHQGQQIFSCSSTSSTSASFIRPTRKADVERTVLEAIGHKYATDTTDDSIRNDSDVVVISGKVAEEVGFDKIARQQSQLAKLKVAVLNDLVINGISKRGSNQEEKIASQQALTVTCPNIVELDIGWNTIERWQDIVDICVALPKLQILKASGLRMHLVRWDQEACSNVFSNLKELHLDSCLLRFNQLAEIIWEPSEYPALHTLSVSENGFQAADLTSIIKPSKLADLKSLLLENNNLRDLDSLATLRSLFPQMNSLSLQGNCISSIGNLVKPEMHRTLEIVNLSHNLIGSYAFIDDLSQILPNLSSLRISNNPLYEQPGTDHVSLSKSLERSFYLTLARIPSLTNLNYTKISTRERDEGELYYISIVERDIKSMISRMPADQSLSGSEFVQRIQKQFPQYSQLCSKYGRNSIVDQISAMDSPRNGNEISSLTRKNVVVEYPVGSLGHRLINATFYVSSSPENVFQRSIPRTAAVNTLKAMLLQHFHHELLPLQFKLIYESSELDPADLTTESSTRSQAYGESQRGSKKSREEQWQEWGEWDADAIVENVVKAAHNVTDENGTVEHQADESWTDDGYLIKEGRKWKKREVPIPSSMRKWGDWIEEDVREVKIRIEPYEKM